MYECLICHFEVVLDDCVVVTTKGRSICVGCYHRQIGDASLPKLKWAAAYAEALASA